MTAVERSAEATWIRPLPPGETDWQRVAALFGADAGGRTPIGELIELHSAYTRRVDPVLLELSRLRMATMLRDHDALALRSPDATAAGLDEAKIAALAQWPTSPRFTARERACLAFTEQFVLDVQGVTDALTDAMLEHLSPDECYAFVHAVWILEVFQKFCLTFGLAHDTESERLSRLATRP